MVVQRRKARTEPGLQAVWRLKRSKKLLRPGVRLDLGPRQRIKVFWFFFSKKNIFLHGLPYDYESGGPKSGLSNVFRHRGLPILPMRCLPFVPALALASAATFVLLWASLVPSGTATMLARLPSTQQNAAIVAAADADAALLSAPRPGYAVLRGDATKIRHALHFAIGWEGAAGCAAPSP
jgi:hypothetical protein